MSLDIHLIEDGVTVYTCNITNNLKNMVQAFGEKYYLILWKPQELEIFTSLSEIQAKDLIFFYEEILIELIRNRKEYERYNSPNGWGTYDDLLNFLVQLVSYCHKYPKATVHAYL